MFINTLTEAAFRTLEKVAQLPQIPEFYLAGDSAAALYLGHRVSIDLDFFTERQSYQSEPLIQSIQGVGNLYLQQQSQGTLVGLLDDVPPRSITEWDWNEIKEFFKNEVKIIMQQMA